MSLLSSLASLSISHSASVCTSTLYDTNSELYMIQFKVGFHIATTSTCMSMVACDWSCDDSLNHKLTLLYIMSALFQTVVSMVSLTTILIEML